MSPCPPGQTTLFTIVGAAGFEMSTILKPWKLPMYAWVPPNARSDVTNANEPGLVGVKKPAGLSTCARCWRLLLADWASSQPAPRPMRGSGSAAVAAAPGEARDERDGRGDGQDAGGTFHGGAFPWYGPKAISTGLVGAVTLTLPSLVDASTH